MSSWKPKPFPDALMLLIDILKSDLEALTPFPGHVKGKKSTCEILIGSCKVTGYLLSSEVTAHLRGRCL